MFLTIFIDMVSICILASLILYTLVLLLLCILNEVLISGQT